jgi:hypothetical protein
MGYKNKNCFKCFISILCVDLFVNACFFLQKQNIVIKSVPKRSVSNITLKQFVTFFELSQFINFIGVAVSSSCAKKDKIIPHNKFYKKKIEKKIKKAKNSLFFFLIFLSSIFL